MDLLTDVNTLKCPNCGQTYLHHRRVDIFQRKEDRARGLHVSVAGQALKVDTNLDGNPSGRRHGMSIEFWCETCPKRPVLAVAQHKGQTYVWWVKPESKDEES